jgi:hypothetical protein
MIGDNSLPDYPSLRACRDIQLIANPVASVAPELTNFRLEEKNDTLTTRYYLSLHQVQVPPSQGAWYCVYCVTAFTAQGASYCVYTVLRLYLVYLVTRLKA